MPRPARSAATVSMKGWLIPAPAPWANTNPAVARAGFVSNAETEPALPASILSFSALTTVITLEPSEDRAGREDTDQDRLHGWTICNIRIDDAAKLGINQLTRFSRRRPAAAWTTGGPHDVPCSRANSIAHA